MIYLANLRNLVRLGLVTATNVAPSDTYFRSNVEREGGGTVSLSGSYTGVADTTFEIEILNTTISGAPQISAPTFVGVGNGSMTEVTVGGFGSTEFVASAVYAEDDDVRPTVSNGHYYRVTVAGTAGTEPTWPTNGTTVTSGGVTFQDQGLITPAQRFTATLVDLGTETRKAYAPLQGVTLRAKLSGPPGNAITLSVSLAGLSYAATAWSLLDPLRKGVNEYRGLEWDFGAAVLTPEGFVPADAPRLRFGDDPQVYRTYKQYLNGEYVHSFSPAPVRDVQDGVKVRTVSGGRTVTLSNALGVAATTFATTTAYTTANYVKPTTPNSHWYGVTVAGTSGGSEPTWPTNGGTVVSGGVTFIDLGLIQNVYSSIATLYDLLAAIQADSGAMVTIDEAVVLSQTPGGMAAVDFSVLTASFLASTVKEGTQFSIDAEINLVVASNAPTEVLTLRCTNADVAGAEIWSAVGSVSGVLADATTGVAYDGTYHDFTIPIQLPPGEEPTADVKSAALVLVNRGEDEQLPSLCYEIFLGAEARTMEEDFIWTKRPPAECECDLSDGIGGPNDEWLGLDVEEGGNVGIPTALQTRAEDVSEWVRDFVGGNMSLFLDMADQADFSIDEADVQFGLRVEPLFYGTLKAVFDHLGENWDDEHAAVVEWDDALADLITDMADFEALSTFYGWDQTDEVESAGVFLGEGQAYRRKQVDAWLKRYETRMEHVKRLAGIEPNFEGATTSGTGPWQDYGDTHWLVHKDGRYLPIQPPHFYHFAVRGPDGVPVSTHEAGINPVIGCMDKMKVGDILRIKITIAGNPRHTYQAGDTHQYTIIRAAPVPFGGGQTGDDTLTWRIAGDVDGVLDDYELVTTAPAPYSDNGVGFQITPAGLAFALGDAFTFWVEGGEFRWRKGAGSWTTESIAPVVVLSDGLSATFAPGAAPSFAPGDTYEYTVEAINGPAQAQRLTGGFMRLTGETNRLDIDVSALSAEERAAAAVFLGDHDGELGDTFRLIGSNSSDYSSPQTDELSVTALVHNGFLLAAERNRPYYRLEFDQPIAAGWVYLGPATRLAMPVTGAPEYGRVVRQLFLPTTHRRRGVGVEVQHTALNQVSVDELEAMLDYASEHDRGRLAILGKHGNDEPAAAALVAYEAESLRVQELSGHQSSTSTRILEVALTLQPVP